MYGGSVLFLCGILSVMNFESVSIQYDHVNVFVYMNGYKCVCLCEHMLF